MCFGESVREAHRTENVLVEVALGQKGEGRFR